MSFQVCIKTFVPLVSPGVQTITGVTDQDTGAQFIGKLFFFFGHCTVNTIMAAPNAVYGVGPYNLPARHISWGTDYFNVRQAGISTDEGNGPDLFGPPPNFVIRDVDGSECGVKSSVINNLSSESFGGFTRLVGYVSSVSSGQFDITYSHSDGDTVPFLVIILGGDDLTIDQQGYPLSTGSNPVISTANTPAAIIFNNSSSLSSPATGAGGGPIAIGWAAKNPDTSLTQGAISSHDLNAASKSSVRYSNSSKCYSVCTVQSGPVDSMVPDVGILAINNNSFQTDGNGPVGSLWTSLGGIKSSAGTIRQPGSSGNQSIDTKLNWKIILFISTAKISNSSIDTNLDSVTIGVMDRSGRQACYWTGEAPGLGVSDFVKGARTLRDDSTILFATPNGTSTTLSSQAKFSSASGTIANLNWTSVGAPGTPDIFWLALGTADFPPPPVPLSGIYKLVQGKTHDTLIDYIYSYYYYTTEDFAIPDPFIITALFGDE